MPAQTRHPVEPKSPPVLSAAAGSTPPVAGLSALELLAQKRRKPVSPAESSENQAAAEAQGEAPDLQMDVEVDEKGELVLRTAVARKETPESRDEAQAKDYGAANRAMAEEEQNILRHHDDYDAYQNMDEPTNPEALNDDDRCPRCVCCRRSGLLQQQR